MEEIKDIEPVDKVLRISTELWQYLVRPIPNDHQNYNALHELLKPLKLVAKREKDRLLVKDGDIDVLEGGWNWETNWFEFKSVDKE